MLLNAQSVARDTVVNQLFGGSGLDWFWLSHGATVADVLSNLAAGEVTTFE